MRNILSPMPLYLTFALAFCGFVQMTAARVVLSLYALDLGAQAYAVGILIAMFFWINAVMMGAGGVLTRPRKVR